MLDHCLNIVAHLEHINKLYIYCFDAVMTHFLSGHFQNFIEHHSIAEAFDFTALRYICGENHALDIVEAELESCPHSKSKFRQISGKKITIKLTSVCSVTSPSERQYLLATIMQSVDLRKLFRNGNHMTKDGRDPDSSLFEKRKVDQMPQL